MEQTHNDYLTDGIAAFEAKHFPIAAQILASLAEKGEAEAQFRMAVMQQNGLGMVANPDAAFANMQNAARQNHPLAMHSLGFMYYKGECTEQNYAMARDWFEKAAKAGMPGSMMTLGMMYANGEGVEQDEAKAEYWFELADKGYAKKDD